jgi:uncharacterized protein YecT (DUF1311 family)
MRQFPTAIALICMFATPASADDPKVDCANQISTYDMRTCASADLDIADKALNAAYQKALASIKARENQDPPYDNKAYEAALRAAQRAWVAYRDADCNVVTPFQAAGGSMSSLLLLSCLISKTQSRTRDLEDMFIE